MERKTFNKLLKKLAGMQGFTLIEVLVVTAIMGIVSAVAVPNVSGFITSGSLAAANNEAQNVRTASFAYFIENAAWPADSTALTPYVVGTVKATYHFDSNGNISSVTGSDWSNLEWSAATQKWNSVMDDEEDTPAETTPAPTTVAPTTPAPTTAAPVDDGKPEKPQKPGKPGKGGKNPPPASPFK